jgi:methyl-accepting chemotaxis protein
MTSGEEKVRDVSAVADQAQVALSDLQRGISRIKDLADATAEISEAQAVRMAGLAERMANVASISSTSAKQADGAASAMATQQHTIGDLKAVSGQLAELAERVQGSIARFSVTDPNEMRVRSAASRTVATVPTRG